MSAVILFGLTFLFGMVAGVVVSAMRPKSPESELMHCPKDLSEWVNSDSAAMWYVYDVNLMPEQIKTKNQACGLRGFKFGWECRKLAEKAESKEA